MEDDPYMDGYADGQSDTHQLYDISNWKRWTPPDSGRVPINIHPQARDRLASVLFKDRRFDGMTPSQFIMAALDLLTQ
jgi:hypothetical protein